MRWLGWVRRVLVVALLAAPVVVVVLVARPSGGGRTTERSLAVGDETTDQLAPGELHRYDLTGDGRIRIGVRGQQPFDATLRVVDANGGEVAFNDDTNGLDPEVVVDLDDGYLVVEVRELSGSPGAYTVFAERAG